MNLKHLIFYGVALAAVLVAVPACTSENDIPKSVTGEESSESYTDEEIIQIYESRRADMESQTVSGSRVVGGSDIDFLLMTSEIEQVKFLLNHPNNLAQYQQELSARYNLREYYNTENQCIDYLISITSANDVQEIYEFGSTYGGNTNSNNNHKILMSYCSNRPKIIQDIMIDAAVRIDGVHPTLVTIEDKSIDGYCEVILLEDIGKDIAGHEVIEYIIDAAAAFVTPEFALAMKGYTLLRFVMQLYRYYQYKETHQNSSWANPLDSLPPLIPYPYPIEPT